jgi:hypothetical protein
VGVGVVGFGVRDGVTVVVCNASVALSPKTLRGCCHKPFDKLDSQDVGRINQELEW